VVISCMSQCLALSGRIDPSCKTFFNLLVTSHIHNQQILFNNTNYCMFIILIEKKNQNWDTIHTELSPTYMVTREDRQIENEMRAEQKPTYRDHAKKGACKLPASENLKPQSLRGRSIKADLSRPKLGSSRENKCRQVRR
jgi:hypothetical protein